MDTGRIGSVGKIILRHGRGLSHRDGINGVFLEFRELRFLRALTGAGIGGEYAAINSAIDELIPARVRGRVDLMINGSYWLGAALGSTATIVLLNPRWLPLWLGWRCAFGIGATLGLVIIFFRRWIPESPRWLMIHGRNAEAEQIVGDVERMITLHPETLPAHDSPPTRIHTRTHTPWHEIWNAIVHEHRRRSLLGLVLMLTQAFFYNAIFFTYALVLMRFYAVPAKDVGGYLLPFALGNVLGPILLGHLFRYHRPETDDHRHLWVGRCFARPDWMAFHAGMLTAQTQTLAWTVIFFVASAAASSAYLTVSEIFPLEIRALAIAIFTRLEHSQAESVRRCCLGGSLARDRLLLLFIGYLVAAALMILGAVVEAWIGVPAERRSLEHVAAPLSSKGL